jgi:hypothetical protein
MLTSFRRKNFFFVAGLFRREPLFDTAPEPLTIRHDG